jgi:radical SAM protein with 4Fe4S-binding SPASM domain
MIISNHQETLAPFNQARVKSHLALSPDCDCVYFNNGILSIRTNANGCLPTVYALELTPTCNNRCPGCGNVFIAAPYTRCTNKTRSPLHINDWERILDTIVPYAQRLSLTGGEPTLHPYFERIILAIEHRGIPFTLFTNGRWANSQQVIALLQNSSQNIGLLVSLHGTEAATHEAWTGVPGSFAETVQTIQHAARAGLRVHTNTVLTHSTCQQVEATVRFSQSLGAECAVFNRPIGTALAAFAVPHNTLRQALQQVEQKGRVGQWSAKIGTCIPTCFADTSAVGCGAGTVFCTIDPWGNVRPCNHAPCIAGNLLHEPLEVLWQSEEMKVWREMIPIECMGCAEVATCGGGCRAEVVLKGLQRDPLMTGSM